MSLVCLPMAIALGLANRRVSLFYKVNCLCVNAFPKAKTKILQFCNCCARVMHLTDGLRLRLLHKPKFKRYTYLDITYSSEMNCRLSSRKYKSQNSIVQVGPFALGGRSLVMMAGPCTIGDEAGLLKTALSVRESGAHILRGGAYKTRTAHDTFQGLGESALEMLARVRKNTGMPVVTEITDVQDLDLIGRYADMLQIGSRNMQNTVLLKAVGKCRYPVLLKRGFSNTVDEWLAAADYILAGGNEQVILCERGIRTFESSTRFSLDILSVPVIKNLSHLPVIVDPSHAAGKRELVGAISKAAIAASADGLLIEVDCSPSTAQVDGRQTITTGQFAKLIPQLRAVAHAVGREL